MPYRFMYTFIALLVSVLSLVLPEIAMAEPLPREALLTPQYKQCMKKVDIGEGTEKICYGEEQDRWDIILTDRYNDYMSFLSTDERKAFKDIQLNWWRSREGSAKWMQTVPERGSMYQVFAMWWSMVETAERADWMGKNLMQMQRQESRSRSLPPIVELPKAECSEKIMGSGVIIGSFGGTDTDGFFLIKEQGYAESRQLDMDGKSRAVLQDNEVAQGANVDVKYDFVRRWSEQENQCSWSHPVRHITVLK